MGNRNNGSPDSGIEKQAAELSGINNHAGAEILLKQLLEPSQRKHGGRFNQ